MKAGKIVILFIATITMHCQSRQSAEIYLPKVDSLHQALSKSESNFRKIDINSLKQKLDSTKHILEHYNDDNQNNEVQIIVLSGNVIQDGLEHVIRTYPDIIEELNFTRKQITDLTYDIENKQIDAKTAEIYIMQEQNAVRVLCLKMDYFTELAGTNRLNFRKLADYLLKSKNERAINYNELP